MQLALVSIFALVCAVLAQQPNGPNAFNNPVGFSLTAGKPTTITWNPTTPGTVTLKLRSGANSDLNQGTVIEAKIPNSGSYTYTPPTDTVRNSDYTIEIVSDDDTTKVNYTPQFVIESKNTVVPITSSASASSAASSASSAASSASSAASSSASSASSASSVASSVSSRSSVLSSSSSSVSASSASSASRTESRSSASASASASSVASRSSASASATSAPTTAPGNSAASAKGGFSVLMGLALGVVALW